MQDNMAEDLAVIISRFNDHEASCNARMFEVRETFKEVKDMNRATQNLIMGLLVAVASAGVMLIMSVIMKKIGLG